MNIFEKLFLDMGFSWTLSKAIPYFLFTLIGFFVFWLFIRKRVRKPSLRVLLLVTGSLTGFFTYFLYAPIYEGDFSNNGEQLISGKELKKEISGKELIVITIPGCPFCAESVERMKIIKSHDPSIKITYVVCSKQKENLLPYQQMAGGEFEVKLAKDPEFMANISKGAFPSFLLVDGNKATHWSNDSFGVRAVDFVTGEF